jgi:NADPH2:quinone reductase
MRAVVITEHGPPEVLQVQERPDPQPGRGEVLVDVRAAGVNFADLLARIGLYPDAPKPPAVVGYEVSGVVAGVGDGVDGDGPLAVGARVVAPIRFGGYADRAVVKADGVVAIPDELDFEAAAAIPINYATAWEALIRLGNVQAGERILIHAAAGGVGLIVCQWAKHLGATVIGTVGDDQKAALAKENGRDHPINYRREDFVARVAEITGGKKCPVVYDSVGKDTFYKSLDCVAPLGLLASFGQSSGPYGPVDIGILAGKGSLFLTRPTLNTYTATREDLLTAARELFEVVQKGVVKLQINQTYPLRDAAQAHRDLQDRKTTGSTVYTV